MSEDDQSLGRDGISRRTALQTIGAAGLLPLTGIPALAKQNSGATGNPPGRYEIWALDQGTDTGYIYTPSERPDDEFALIDELDFGEYGGETPHMIDFSSNYRYAAVACTGGDKTLVVRTTDREVVADLDTGAVSHFAGFSPDDEYIHVDAIGENAIVRVDVDLEREEFEIEGEIAIADLEGFSEEQDPVCHDYDHRGRSIHTLGPSYHDAGVVIVDHDEFEVVESFTHDELPANCGTVAHPTEEKFYLTAGLPSDPDAEEGTVDAEGVGEYYVLDTESDEILVDGESTEGIDAHGFWFTADDEELWVLNRETNDGVVVDPGTDEIIGEIEEFGPATDEEDTENRDAPDIMWSSPDDEYVFVTLRGPNPLSGDPHASTGVNPGFAVMEVESRDRIDVIQPDGDNEDSDFHGVGVRVIGPALYADPDGIVRTEGLREAIDDWRAGDIDTDLLRDVIAHWRSGDPVE